jgi:hypothetical protein
MKFYVPDWDDRVDPGFDFLSDRPTLGRDPYRDDQYAHELMSEPVYDGVLVSLMALANGGAKRARIEKYGLRGYLRLPSQYELLGDCGAWGYIRDPEPAFTPEQALTQYEQLGVDYGVSVDHLIVTEFEEQKQARYDMTLRNAERFLQLHRERGSKFTPIGAIQGWSPETYVQAAQAEVAMGYTYLGLGGLARSNTATVRGIVEAVSAAVPSGTRLHVFGVARLPLLPLFIERKVTSVDSAAPLRQAWLSANDNYYALDRTYAAIRVPVASEERPKATRSRTIREEAACTDGQQLLPGLDEGLLGASTVSLAELQGTERRALAALRAYDRREVTLQQVMTAVMAYDRLLGSRAFARDAVARERLYRETLKDRPWKKCRCTVCQAIGIDVVIFRRNDRNRRRGFHNLHIVRERIVRLTQHPPVENAPPPEEQFLNAIQMLTP